MSTSKRWTTEAEAAPGFEQGGGSPGMAAPAARSSTIASVAWTDSGQLLVEFVAGARYRYSNVPRVLYDILVGQAPGVTLTSAGKFFAAAIKAHPDQYPYERV